MWAPAAVQPDGRIVVVGTKAADFVVTRYLPDGRLDPSFGDGGVVTIDIAGRHDIAKAVGLKADGGIIVAGAATVGNSLDFALVGLTPDGALAPRLRRADHRLQPPRRRADRAPQSIGNGRIVAESGALCPTTSGWRASSPTAGRTPASARRAGSRPTSGATRS